MSSDPPQAPGWYADPHGRHERRYWDGSTWTERVADGGASGTDPIGAPPPPPAAGGPGSGAPAPATGTGAGTSRPPVALLAGIGVLVLVVVVVGAIVLLAVNGDGDGDGDGSFDGEVVAGAEPDRYEVRVADGGSFVATLTTSPGVEVAFSVSVAEDLVRRYAEQFAEGTGDDVDGLVEEARAEAFDDEIGGFVLDSDTVGGPDADELVWELEVPDGEVLGGTYVVSVAGSPTTGSGSYELEIEVLEGS